MSVRTCRFDSCQAYGSRRIEMVTDAGRREAERLAQQREAARKAEDSRRLIQENWNKRAVWH